MDSTPTVARITETGAPTAPMKLADGGAGGCTGGPGLERKHGSSFYDVCSLTCSHLPSTA